MKIVQGNRGSGKTTRMISWFIENPGHRGIIVPNEMQRRHVIKETVKFFPHMETAKHIWPGVPFWHVHIWTPSNVHQARGREIHEIWIDNFDMLLRDLVGSASITLTTSEEVEIEHL